MRNFESTHFASHADGPRLIVTGAVHGNEVCGTLAIRRVLDDFQHERLRLQSGSVSFVPVTNPLAYKRRQRQGDRNLNRRLAPTPTPTEFEDHVANWLCPLLARHDVLLDLHSFQTGDEPFVMVGPPNNDGALEPFAHAEREEALALRLGVTRLVDGWLGTYVTGVAQRRARSQSDAGQHHPDYGVGTTEYMRRCGGWGLTLECGQHDDPRSPEVAYRAILNTLAHLGLIDAAAPPPASGVEGLNLFQVIDRLDPADRFTRAWTSFDAVLRGDTVALRHDGTPVVAAADGRIVFPNPNAAPGQEWFYLARPHARFGA